MELGNWEHPQQACAANPYFGLKGLDIGGLLAAGVPYPCFPTVKADVGLCMQVLC